MRARIILTMLCAAITLAGCAQSEKLSSHSDWSSDLGDALPTDIPLPTPGINQRPVVGTKTVLVMVIHWSDGDTLNYQLTKKQTLSTDPDSLQTYISAASNGKLNLTGQVIEGTSIPRPDSCKGGPNKPVSFAVEEGKKIALAQGINPNNFDYLISMIDCFGGAVAHTPGNIIVAFGQPGIAHLFKHEFGHNLGYEHGLSYTECYTASNVVSAPGSCKIIGYGDSGDPVSGGQALYPAINRWYSGWLDDSQVAIIEDSGLYFLAKLGNEGPQLYLINRPGLTPAQVALEHRKPTPYDHYTPPGSFLPGDNRVSGVWIRYTTMGHKLLNTQLDGTPLTATLEDPTFLPGKVFSDLNAGIRVEVCSVTEYGALIQVDVKGQSLPNLCKTPILALPRITNPPITGTLPNPVVVSGTGISGATMDIKYRLNNQGDWKLLSVPPADAHGNWQTQPLSLSPGDYTLSVMQSIDSKKSGFNVRSFKVIP